MGEKRLQLFFSSSFFGHAVQQVNLSVFHQALIKIAQQTRLTFDLEIRDNLWSLLYVPDKAT